MMYLLLVGIVHDSVKHHGYRFAKTNLHDLYPDRARIGHQVIDT